MPSAETLVVAAVLLVLLAADWFTRRRAIRVAAILAASAVLAFSYPSLTVAGWRAAAAERSGAPIVLRGDTLTGYWAGMHAMRMAVTEQIDRREATHTLAVVSLIWLALTPALRGRLNAPAVADRRESAPEQAG